MAKNLQQLLKNTRDSMKKLRTHVQDLKENQRRLEQQSLKDFEKPHAPKSSKQPERVLVEFSSASVAKATLVIIGLYLLTQFLFEIRDVLILLFISLFLAAALDSIVDRLQQHRIPRGVSVIGIYLVFFAVMVILISTLIPLVASQTLELATTVGVLISNLTQNQSWLNLPYASNLKELLEQFFASVDQQTLISNLQSGLEQVGRQLQNIAGNTFGAIKVLFDGVFNALIVMVITFFLIVDEKGFEKFLTSLFPSKHGKYIVEKSRAVKENIGAWLRGQLKLMVLIGFVTFIALWLLGVEYALTLALIAGITELIPVVGPLIAMVPALLIGLNDSLSQTLWILVLYVVIQQLEGNLIVPMIMKQAVGLNPIIVIISMLIGFTFLGVLGVIIAVPVATGISIFIKDYTTREK